MSTCSAWRIIACLLAICNASPAHAQFKVTLLGTGSPQLRPDRSGPSTLIEAGDQKFIVDAGRGVPIRLRQLGASLGQIDVLFLTHFHSDHTSGIPDLWLTAWLPGPAGGRTTPFRVIGPVGAKALTDGLEKAYALDVKIRLEDEKLPSEGVRIETNEFEADGTVYEKNGVKVIAFTVDHGPAIRPAVGYRIEYQGRAVTISGDTRYDGNVIKYGTGADLLIHEVASARSELMSNVFVQRIMAHHTTPEEAGRVFAQAKPKLAAYTHFVLLSGASVPEPTLDHLVAETRKAYAGPLEVGEDLMSFEIGDSVVVRRFQR